MAAATIAKHLDLHCRPCNILKSILVEASHRHRAYEPWAYDVMDTVLHEELDEQRIRSKMGQSPPREGSGV